MARDRDGKIKDKERGAHAKRGARVRRPYVAPSLVEYGSVAKLTQSGGVTTRDFLWLRRRGR